MLADRQIQAGKKQLFPDVIVYGKQLQSIFCYSVRACANTNGLPPDDLQTLRQSQK